MAARWLLLRGEVKRLVCRGRLMSAKWLAPAWRPEIGPTRQPPCPQLPSLQTLGVYSDQKYALRPFAGRENRASGSTTCTCLLQRPCQRSGKASSWRPPPRWGGAGKGPASNTASVLNARALPIGEHPLRPFGPAPPVRGSKIFWIST